MGPLGPAELTEEEDGQVIKVSGQAANAETPGGCPWPVTGCPRAQQRARRPAGSPIVGGGRRPHETVHHFRHRVKEWQRVIVGSDGAVREGLSEGVPLHES